MTSLGYYLCWLIHSLLTKYTSQVLIIKANNKNCTQEIAIIEGLFWQSWVSLSSKDKSKKVNMNDGCLIRLLKFAFDMIKLAKNCNYAVRVIFRDGKALFKIKKYVNF